MSLFTHDTEIYTASAPGRLDVMGGIADYSGSLLLQMPTKEFTSVEIQLRHDGLFQIESLLADGDKKKFVCQYRDFDPATSDWASYVIGCFYMLEREKNIKVSGANIRVRSTVPLGKGVSSSASLEVAVMRALCKMHDIRTHGYELPVLAQKVENEVVGAACGLMDQLAVYFGERKKLLPLQCQPCTVFEPLFIPAGIEFCGIDSGVRHAVGSSSYSDVRTAAFMGYTMIATHEGVSDCELQKAKIDRNFQQLPYSGYLANIPVDRFNKRYLPILPETVSGEEFLNQYKISLDHFTHVQPEKKYRLRACTSHPVLENFRVSRFQELMLLLNDYPLNENILSEMGKLMIASHESYSNVGLGNAKTDEIVRRVTAAGPDSGLYGARVSGGGNGGTVAILCNSKAGLSNARAIRSDLEEFFGQSLHFFE